MRSSSLKPFLQRIFRGVFTGSMLTGAMAAHAAWPEKPVTLVVSYSAGGSVDLIARLIAQPLSERIGQPVVIENIGGAGGVIGASKVARAPADGYTLMLGSGSEVAIAWAVNPSLKYNGLKDLAPISLIATSPMLLVANSQVPAKTLEELFQYSKAHPGKLSLATSGVGTPQHLLLEFINRRTGADIMHVPYRSASGITTDVIGGRVDLSILTLSTGLPYVEAAKLQAYAVTGAETSPLLPKLPSLNKYPKLEGADFDLWFGLLAPAGVPPAIISRVHKELAAVLQLPDVRESIAKQGMNVASITTAEFAAYVKADSAKYQRIIKDANISVK